ncbi:hypothetical protein JAAARDRAFT_502036 [Jaapia argillacea MUCL 33604]|uniref:Uncharacterized protein n=1 Tax=Jaapia argillacea MUCL 33604 TaxID=933084 RepID=A0A067PKW1_9AGAM|nr:hypothetical protein JAAARDRAFT_502036 [Jaapia argillacea MUCL 33604]
MPPEGTRFLFEFENQEDILNFVHQVADSPTHSLDTDSSSIVSNQPGPGRTLDNVISVAGRHLESALNSISERLGRRQNVAMGYLLEFEDESDLEAMMWQFGPTHSFDVDESSIVSDQPGPGRTLGKIISVVGSRLEVSLSDISERLGNGPNSTMDRCILAANRAWRSHYPPPYRPILSRKRLQRPPPLVQMLEDVFGHSYVWELTPVCQDRVFINSCERLISYLRSDKLGNHLPAIYYITALASCKLDILLHLVRLGAPRAIHAASLRHSLLSKGDRDRSSLLASSRSFIWCLRIAGTINLICPIVVYSYQTW